MQLCFVTSLFTSIFLNQQFVTCLDWFGLEARNLTDYDKMCSSAWYQLETGLNLPKITSEDFKKSKLHWNDCELFNK